MEASEICKQCSECIPVLENRTQLQEIWSEIMKKAFDTCHCKCLDFILRNGCLAIGCKTVLPFSAYIGHHDCVRYFASLGADVNAVAPRGYSALMEATKANAVASVSALLEAGANVNYVNHHGNTALHFAHNDTDIIRLLLRFGAKINNRNKDYQNAFQHYLGHSDLQKKSVCMLFLAAGEILDGKTVGRTLGPFGLVIGSSIPDFLPDPDPELSLMNICRKAVRKHLVKLDPHTHLFLRVPRLEIPIHVQEYLLYDQSLDSFHTESDEGSMEVDWGFRSDNSLESDDSDSDSDDYDQDDDSDGEYDDDDVSVEDKESGKEEENCENESDDNVDEDTETDEESINDGGMSGDDEQSSVSGDGSVDSDNTDDDSEDVDGFGDKQVDGQYDSDDGVPSDDELADDSDNILDASECDGDEVDDDAEDGDDDVEYQDEIEDENDKCDDEDETGEAEEDEVGDEDDEHDDEDEADKRDEHDNDGEDEDEDENEDDDNSCGYSSDFYDMINRKFTRFINEENSSARADYSSDGSNNEAFSDDDEVLGPEFFGVASDDPVAIRSLSASSEDSSSSSGGDTSDDDDGMTEDELLMMALAVHMNSQNMMMMCVLGAMLLMVVTDSRNRR